MDPLIVACLWLVGVIDSVLGFVALGYRIGRFIPETCTICPAQHVFWDGGCVLTTPGTIITGRIDHLKYGRCPDPFVLAGPPFRCLDFNNTTAPVGYKLCEASVNAYVGTERAFVVFTFILLVLWAVGVMTKRK
jgi:hypothetical protein